jgi:hypothetical protein
MGEAMYFGEPRLRQKEYPSRGGLSLDLDINPVTKSSPIEEVIVSLAYDEEFQWCAIIKFQNFSASTRLDAPYASCN